MGDVAVTTTERDPLPANDVDLEHHGAAFRDDNRNVVARLHGSGCPIGHSDHYGGFWAIYGYQAVYDATHDSELFSSRHAPPEIDKGVPSSGTPLALLPIDFDGPIVQEQRRIVLSYFSPGTAAREEPRLREIAHELVDEFIERGHCDLTQELLTPLPARWILEALGWDTTDWRGWIELLHTLVHDRAEQPEKAQAAVEELARRVMTEVATRRASGDLGDDLTGAILRGTPGGEPLPEHQVIGYLVNLLLGGMDTTAGLTGNVVEELDRDHELRQRLIDDRSLLPVATEEFLRHDSPAFGLYRTVMRDEVFHGQQLHAGDRAVILFPAAGFDPAAYEHPDEIRLDRTGSRHLSFGVGPHRCLGSHHARVMFRVMIDEVLTRLPDFEISGPVVRYQDAGDVWAIRHLPVTFTPGPRLLDAQR